VHPSKKHQTLAIPDDWASTPQNPGNTTSLVCEHHNHVWYPPAWITMLPTFYDCYKFTTRNEAISLSMCSTYAWAEGRDSYIGFHVVGRWLCNKVLTSNKSIYNQFTIQNLQNQMEHQLQKTVMPVTHSPHCQRDSHDNSQSVPFESTEQNCRHGESWIYIPQGKQKYCRAILTWTRSPACATTLLINTSPAL
jgi:hypothetical protein